MDKSQKTTSFILILLGLVYFLLFIPPNSVGSKDIEMVQVFQPDEAVPLPYLLKMIQPSDSPKQALVNFFFYQYYFYGFLYFAYSAVWLLPLKWFSLMGNMTLIMVMLRQLVSLLPILLSVYLLVYLQTQFKGYRAIILFVFLLSIPAVFLNNFWWHPDGLSTFFAILTIFLLERDNLSFGRNFYLASITCGICAGIKGVGFFFFLTILVYLIMGIINKKVSMQRIILSAVGFLACMAGSFLLANPTLVYAGAREIFIRDSMETAQRLSQGYTVVYAKGLQVSLPQLVEDYSSVPFLIMTFFLCLWGMFRGTRRLLYTILLTWAIPITVMIFFLIHYKHQYWLPVSLPLFSTVTILFPERISIQKVFKNKKFTTWPAIILIGLLFFQFGNNLNKDTKVYSQALHREEKSPAIRFYNQVVKVMSHLSQNRSYHILQDVRMYVPPSENWYSEAVFDLLNYDLIREKNFHVLLILQQRICDYLESSVEGLDPQSFSAVQDFYRDAKNGEIRRYKLVYEDSFGLIFIHQKTYNEFYIEDD